MQSQVSVVLTNQTFQVAFVLKHLASNGDSVEVENTQTTEVQPKDYQGPSDELIQVDSDLIYPGPTKE